MQLLHAAQYTYCKLQNSMSSLIVSYIHTFKYSRGTNLTKIWGQVKTNQPQWSPWVPPELHIFNVFYLDMPD